MAEQSPSMSPPARRAYTSLRYHRRHAPPHPPHTHVHTSYNEIGDAGAGALAAALWHWIRWTSSAFVRASKRAEGLCGWWKAVGKGLKEGATLRT